MCAGAFPCAQVAVAATAGTLGWIPPLDVVEAAAALTLAYLGSETLFLSSPMQDIGGSSAARQVGSTGSSWPPSWRQPR